MKKKWMSRVEKLKWTLSILSLLTGCSTVVHTTYKALPHTKLEAESLWRRTLHQYVDELGSVDLKRLAVNRYDLEAYLNWIATHGPRTDVSNYSGLHEKM